MAGVSTGIAHNWLGQFDLVSGGQAERGKNLFPALLADWLTQPSIEEKTDFLFILFVYGRRIRKVGFKTFF